MSLHANTIKIPYSSAQATLKKKKMFFLKQYKVKALLLELIDFTINRQLAKVQNVIIN